MVAVRRLYIGIDALMTSVRYTPVIPYSTIRGVK